MKEQDRGIESRVVRNDIEGLRALAVISVLINHAAPNALTGGFVGVDIFFVISGYLIGRHLLQDIAGNRFSFLDFYVKRSRRIFPALALMLICVWSVGWLVLSASEFLDLGKHIAAASLFGNNILLWKETGYFDAPALDKPLLHLWSLGIEEQFYLLVPALLWLGTSGATGSVKWVARLAIPSLVATILLGSLDYPSSFYLLHTRFWELAAGVILAQSELSACRAAQQERPANVSTRANLEMIMWSGIVALTVCVVIGSSDISALRRHWVDASAMVLAAALAAVVATGRANLFETVARRPMFASALGTALICASIALFGSENWPSARTLYPVLGTALVIAASPTSAPNRILGLKPFAFVGSISYPLYLWHWPAIVFSRMLAPDSANVSLAAPLIAAFALAWVTKICLEDPVRFGKLGAMRFQRPALWLAPAALAILGLLGWWTAMQNGVVSRFPPRLRAIAEWHEVNPDINWRVHECYFYTTDRHEFADKCTPKKRPGVPRVLLWGDSHAAHLYPGLAQLQQGMDFDIVQWTSAACPPTVEPLKEEAPNCPHRRAAAWAAVAQLHPESVLLGGAWGRYLQLGHTQDEILRMLSATVSRLKREGVTNITLFGPGALYQTSLHNDLFRFMARRRLQEIPDRFGNVGDALRSLDTALAAQSRQEGAHYISILNFFCNESGCLTVGDKSLARPDLLYRDEDHLTVSGSKLLIEHSDLNF